MVIAGALVLEPTVLVADEPVSSLDASVRGEILALLLDLVHDLGLSILVITHDLGLAWNIADRVAVMYLGRIVEEGPTEEILSHPKHPYTQALLSVVSEVDHVDAAGSGGRATRPDPDPRRLPVPSPLPGTRIRRGRRRRHRRPLPVRVVATASRPDESCGRVLPF